MLQKQLRNLTLGTGKRSYEVDQVLICNNCGIFWNRDVLASKICIPLQDPFGLVMVVLMYINNKTPPPMRLLNPNGFNLKMPTGESLNINLLKDFKSSKQNFFFVSNFYSWLCPKKVGNVSRLVFIRPEKKTNIV